MEQKVIEKSQEQCIYLIRESNLDFYLVIPNCKKVHIVLGIFKGVDDNFVKRIPKQVDKAVVIPVINSQILEQANYVQTQSYQYLDNVLSFLINTAYRILTYNHIEVDSQIFLNQNADLGGFQQKFLSKYQGRVQLLDLFFKTEVPQKVNLVSDSLETVSPVVSSAVIDEVVDVPTEMPEEKKVNTAVEAREPGFVSYVLLGVLIAVISLVFLYLII
ncbi:MAG: hypothetical protein MR598_04500 [Erysipelotrichaceae bacterium]|nr:hypothetical protein [Erysipelotrichaceae bacterium]